MDTHKYSHTGAFNINTGLEEKQGILMIQRDTFWCGLPEEFATPCKLEPGGRTAFQTENTKG